MIGEKQHYEDISFVTSSFLFLVRPGATSSVLAPSDAPFWVAPAERCVMDS